LELPKGDWAFSSVRQYLFDLYEKHILAGLEKSRHRPIAEAAQKIRREEIYHLRHTSAWVERLGRGTAESRRRMQEALDKAWPMTSQLFSHSREDSHLVYSGYTPSGELFQASWLDEASGFLQGCQLSIPAIAGDRASRRDHTPHLGILVDEMQSVARSEPEAGW
jgi:ring-1,2-phenylacetyl-CoA epoxidase subunit PaaC